MIREITVGEEMDHGDKVWMLRWVSDSYGPCDRPLNGVNSKEEAIQEAKEYFGYDVNVKVKE